MEKNMVSCRFPLNFYHPQNSYFHDYVYNQSTNCVDGFREIQNL